jgi:hypothetical protein
MISKSSCFQGLGRLVGSLALACLLAPAALADCAKDSRGEVYCGAGRCAVDRDGTVWCARTFDGGAERTREGAVVCGKGQCARDSRGQVFCSAQVAGAVLIDSTGTVRCFGACEAATVQNCEHTIAGSAG